MTTAEPLMSTLYQNEFLERLLAGRIGINEIYQMCKNIIEILIKEPPILTLTSEIIVVGDIHGQFFDLLSLLKIAPGKKHLFLGDYVDRGANSFETILLLMHMKITNPDKIWLLRGNHEDKGVSYAYGFYEECMRIQKNDIAWLEICNVFEYLPLGAIIDKEIFAVHGGIGPNAQNIKQLQKINRINYIRTDPTISELLWSDPSETAEEYEKSSRGLGCHFGEKQTKEFLESNGLKRLIRSHQLVNEGYKEHFNGLAITIWSAPNYCYRCQNKAAVARIYNSQIEYIEIQQAPEQKKEIYSPTFFF
ncbi:serine/threonine-protein phosphatase 4 catalytic subunit [Nematocida sp. AWRm80]|nr:serine/threonine-protein phosphatase 4 catalytic subunit [Nematocida sp. AWRm80]